MLQVPSDLLSASVIVPLAEAPAGIQITFPAPFSQESITLSAKGESPNFSFILAAVLVPVMIIGPLLFTGDTPILICTPSPWSPDRPKSPSVTVCLTSLNIYFIPPD